MCTLNTERCSSCILLILSLIRAVASPWRVGFQILLLPLFAVFKESPDSFLQISSVVHCTHRLSLRHSFIQVYLTQLLICLYCIGSNLSPGLSVVILNNWEHAGAYNHIATEAAANPPRGSLHLSMIESHSSWLEKYYMKTVIDSEEGNLFPPRQRMIYMWQYKSRLPSSHCSVSNIFHTS